jgi:hypothetical protein
MVRVNGKKTKIYELDNTHSFKSRLASNMDTLESFLYFPKEFTDNELRNNKHDIIVHDILSEIKDSASKNTNIIKLIENIQSKIGKNKFNKGKDIVKIWLVYNMNLKKDVNIQGKLPLDNIGNILQEKKIYITKSQIHTDWREIGYVKNNLERRIKSNQDNTQKITELFKEYTEIDESAASTEFEIEHIQFVVTMKTKNQSVLEIFNTIVLNNTVPYATTKNFYKILKNFTPPEEWTDSSDDSIILQVAQKKFISTSSDISNFEGTIIKVDPISKHMTMEITVNTSKDNVKRDEFTDRSLSVFKHLNLNILNINESKVIGVFYFPILRLDKYVFSELVMNDPIFSRLISIDDSDKATKMKAGIYIHFEHPLTGYITATLTEKKMIKGDPTMKSVDPDFFEPNGPFIRVKISKADNTKSVELFKEILGKLFILYDEKKDDIIQYYKNYIPSFGDVSQPIQEVVKELKHSDVAPDLFVTLYTRNCKPDRMPSIISEEQAIEANAEGKNIMKFPRDIPNDKDAFKFPKDGEGQNYYICNNPGYKYVGLKNNKLKNADIYPYVPCCFKLDQTNKPKYMNYYEGKELITEEKKQHNIIRTDKILKYDQFGTLPPNLENLFTIIFPDPKFEYVRKGVHDNKNTFINVIMEALNEETKILDVNDKKELDNLLTKERNYLADKKTVPLCRQELYDHTVEEIISMIKDENEYFDPKLYIHLLEDRFDCNIFLFTRKMLEGEMILPRHTQSYYKNINKKRCIYVYEHMGSESDHATYPHCELIVKFNTKKSKGNVQYSFSYKESRNVRNVYSRLRKSYALNNLISETYLPLNSLIKIKSQWIDSYGKTRRLNILYENELISLIISPIQPIKVKETKSTEIFLTNKITAMKLIETLDIQITSQTVINNLTKELSGILGNVSISIPINNTDIIKGIPNKEYGLSFPEKNESSLEKYNINKKIARYLVEYTMWIYSTFLNDNGIVDITNDNISQFAKYYYDIKPNYEYGIIEKTFRKDSPILSKGKIIVNNKETIKRLIYVLRLSIQSNLDGIRTYYKQKMIRNYYVDISDFDKYKNQVILFGEESVNKWSLENNNTYSIHDEIQIGINTPYFFKNNLIDNNVYLAQNTQTINKASDIAVKWVRDGYNVGIYAKDISPVTFTLYSYLNSSNIKDGIKIIGKPFSEEVKIIGYKIDNNAEYTVLLPLSI